PAPALRPRAEGPSPAPGARAARARRRSPERVGLAGSAGPRGGRHQLAGGLVGVLSPAGGDHSGNDEGCPRPGPRGGVAGPEELRGHVSAAIRGGLPRPRRPLRGSPTGPRCRSRTAPLLRRRPPRRRDVPTADGPGRPSLLARPRGPDRLPARRRAGRRRGEGAHALLMHPVSLLVQKYGGTSVDGPERIRAVARRVASARQAGHDTVVVVSAMGQTTDELIGLARQVARAPNRRELDMLLTTGERVAMALLAMALHDLGVEAISFTGSQSGILTDGAHSAARIVDVKPERIRAELARGRVVIVAGFQGVSPRTKEITTL